MVRIKNVFDLTYPLSERGQRQLRLIPKKTLETSYSNEYTVEMHAHLGTHVEGPLHCLVGGKSIGEFPADVFIGEAAIIDLAKRCQQERMIDARALKEAGAHISQHDIIILKTGYGETFPPEEMQSQSYCAKSPYLTADAVDWLMTMKMKMLGIDFWSIEKYPIDPKVGEPLHIVMLRHDIPLIHSLTNLLKIHADRVFFMALPLPIKGLDSSPVRAVAVEWEE